MRDGWTPLGSLIKRKKPVVYYKGKKYISYGGGYIDPEDHGGLTGKPTIVHFRRRHTRHRNKRFYNSHQYQPNKKQSFWNWLKNLFS